VNPLWGNIFRKKSEEESLAYLLGTIPLFTDLNGREIRLLESLVHIRHYDAGETIFKEGDPGSGLYIIRSGRVRIFHLSPSGQEEEVTILGPGDFFGETTLTAPASRTASARALENAELVGLFRADLMEVIPKHPGLANKILMGLTRCISERLHSASYEIRRLKAQLESAATERESAGLPE
jgi:CRP-like cAMP-binding protein